MLKSILNCLFGYFMENECECGEEASFFHSGCCGVHFEGIIKDGKKFIACESCRKIVGELKE